MRGAGIDRTGEELRVLDRPDPREPRDDEVLIRVAAAGMGNWDDIARAGGWDIGVSPPCALGVEAAGTISAAGREVTTVRAGQDVLTHPLPLRQDGTWAQWLIAPAALVAGKPPEVPMTVAGALPVAGLTALQALEGFPGPGATVLVNGAGGVTGGMAVQLAARSGARVIATAGRAGDPRVRGLGADAVLDYHDPDWPKQVTVMTGGGVAAAVNAARGGAAQAIRLVADGGRLATITSDPPDPERGISVRDVYVRPDAAQLGHLAGLAARGDITLTVTATYPLEEAAAALAHVKRGSNGGAIVLTPWQTA
jgi:NADPH:quinone reductase-like Zn-dependent oxidoreductase